MGYKGDKSAARPPEGSLVETRCLKGSKSAIVSFAEPRSGPKSKTGPGVFSTKNVPIFILRPTSVRMWHKAVFKVGPVAGPKPNATGSSKNASDPVGIPLFGAPQASGDKPNPSEEGLSLGGRPLRPEVMYPVVEHTRTNCAARNHSRSRAPYHRTQKGLLILRRCYDTQPQPHE